MAQTYYELLGVAENARDAEIEAAFKSKAREVHPDRVAPGSPYLRKVAAEAFKDLSEAKSVLLDHTERQKYDAGLAYMRGSTTTNSAPPPQPPQSSPPPKQSSQSPSHSQPSPSPAAQPMQKISFWKPINTKFGVIVPAAGILGCILFLAGASRSDRTSSLGVALVCLALGLLCWRHGIRPGTDPKVLGGSIFLFIFAAIFFAASFGPTHSSGDAMSSVSDATRVAMAPAPRVTSPGSLSALNQGPESSAMYMSSQPPSASKRTKTGSAITTTRDNATGITVFSNDAPPNNREPLRPTKPIAASPAEIWKNLRDGQTYYISRDEGILYIASTDSYPNASSDIVSCKLGRAVSVGVSWTGQCWERNPKDRSVYRSEATISTFSSTRIEIRTGDTAPFVMIPASGISGVISQNSTNTGSPATSAVFSEATPSPGK